MLKIKKILIKIIFFKINYNNSVDFQKITKDIKFNTNHTASFMFVNSIVNSDLAITKDRLC
jgi:hypothetical protein